MHTLLKRSKIKRIRGSSEKNSYPKHCNNLSPTKKNVLVVEFNVRKRDVHNRTNIHLEREWAFVASVELQWCFQFLRLTINTKLIDGRLVASHSPTIVSLFVFSMALGTYKRHEEQCYRLLMHRSAPNARISPIKIMPSSTLLKQWIKCVRLYLQAKISFEEQIFLGFCESNSKLQFKLRYLGSFHTQVAIQRSCSLMNNDEKLYGKKLRRTFGWIILFMNSS